MAGALRHRGPDGQDFYSGDGVHFARCDLNNTGRRNDSLSNRGLDVHLTFDGALVAEPNERTGVESVQVRADDSELVRGLWTGNADDLLPRLRGSFAFALHDSKRKQLVLSRDRFGIAPLYVAQQDGWLFFASEIRGLLATGMIPARADLRGLNELFTFFAMPGPRTCFAGISLLQAGSALLIHTDPAGLRTLSERPFWHMDFPDAGQEGGGKEHDLVDRFEHELSAAVSRRIPSDGKVACYLSGGTDSGLVVALARKVMGVAPPTFTIRIDDPALDETSAVGLVAERLGCQPTRVTVGRAETLAAYPRLVAAAESPVIDTACAALLLLGEKVQEHGYRTVLSGEGADEWMGSYPWFRIHRLLGLLDLFPGLNLSNLARRIFLRLSGAPMFPRSVIRRTLKAVGGPNPWLDIYGLVSISKLRFFSPMMREVMTATNPYADLGLDLPRMNRWHPFHRGIALGARIHLPGLLMQAKGDRIAMQSSLQMRYPFLDEKVFGFLAQLHPRWKMKGLQDKYLLRRLAHRYLPTSIAWSRKSLFQAPFEAFHHSEAASFVDQLLSPESLRKTQYFDVAAVEYWRRRVTHLRPGAAQRTSVDMGLAGVLSTQLWHHLFIDPTLADLPSQCRK